MDAGATPFNAQRGVSFLPRNKGAGFKAYKEERRKEVAAAYDEYLTPQERLQHIKTKRPNRRDIGS